MAIKKQTVHVVHYSGFKLPKEECILYSTTLYGEMFAQMVEAQMGSGGFRNIIFDRAHLGEWVYGKIYRDYDADWIYYLEEMYLPYMTFDPPKLIVFVDRPENLIARDDGLSYSIELDKKRFEVDRFIDAYDRSTFQHKLLIDIEGHDADAVESMVSDFLGV